MNFVERATESSLKEAFFVIVSSLSTVTIPDVVGKSVALVNSFSKKELY